MSYDGEIMKIIEIINDALHYPLSGWKKFLIFGFILWISNPPDIVSYFIRINPAIFIFLTILGFITIGFLIRGYEFRIINSSLAGGKELPKFDAFVKMFTDGIRVIIVFIIYLIPTFLIVNFAISFFGLTLGNIISTIPTFEVGILLNANTLLTAKILILISLIYIIIIIPIIFMAISNMAHNNSKLGAALRFREILNKITQKGWINFSVWYLVTGIIFLILYAIGAYIAYLLAISIKFFVGDLFLSFIALPFLNIYLFRSIALFYKTD